MAEDLGLVELRGVRGQDVIEARRGQVERIAEAAITAPTRTCYYHEWRDVTSAQVVSFLTHEAVPHLFDLRRRVVTRELSHARRSAIAGSRRRDA